MPSSCFTGVELEPEVFPAGTDSRFLRKLGIPAFGFSPMAHSPILLHEHNEYVDRHVFLQAIGVYEHVIPALADAPILPTEEAAAAKRPAKRAKPNGVGVCEPCA